MTVGRVRAILKRDNHDLWHARKGAHNRNGYYPGPSTVVELEPQEEFSSFAGLRFKKLKNWIR